MTILRIMRSLKRIWVHLLHKIPSKHFFLFYFRFFNKSNVGMVITLHRITTSDKNGCLNSFIEMSSKKLEKVIVELKKLNVKFVSLNELENSLKDGKRKYPIVHFSFDDGYLDNYTSAFTIFKKYNVCFSIFIATDFINDQQPFLWNYLLENIIENKIPVSFEKYDFEITETMYSEILTETLFDDVRKIVLENLDGDTSYFKEKLFGYVKKNSKFLPRMLDWEQVNEMAHSGLCEIGAHTKTHVRFKKLNDTQKAGEILACKNEIKKNTGIDVKYFAYPYGGVEDIGSTDSLPAIMQACGIQSAFTTVPFELNSASNKYLLPRIFLNNSTTVYTLKTRLDGTYQRNLSFNEIDKKWEV